VSNKDVEIRDQAPMNDSLKNRWVRFAVESSTARPTKQDQRAPIKMVGGRAWSPGIYHQETPQAHKGCGADQKGIRYKGART